MSLVLKVKYTVLLTEDLLIWFLFENVTNLFYGDVHLNAGTFWKGIVPRGTASATKWVFVFSSAVPAKEGM